MGGEAGTFLERAVAAHVAGDLERAEALYRRAGEEGDAEGWFQLGGLLGDRGRDGEALDAYQRAAAAGDPEARLNAGNLLADVFHRPDEALGVYRRAIEAGDVRARTEAGVVLQRLGRVDEAEQELRHAIAGGDPRAHLHLGNLLQEAGDEPAAEREYRRALDAGVAAWAGLALLKEEQGELHQAEAVLRDGVAADDPYAYANLARLLFERGDRHQAEAVLEEALDHGHNVWMTYGNCLADWDGREAEAEQAYRRAIAGGDELAHLNLGTFLRDRGRLAEARAEYREAIESGDEQARLPYAELLHRAGARLTNL